MAQNEPAQRCQFPLVTWQIIAHMAVCTTGIASKRRLWLLVSFLFLFFFKLLPKTQNCQRRSCKTGPALLSQMLTSPRKPPGQPHSKSFLSPEKTSFHSLMDSSLLCSVPSARVSQGQGRISLDLPPTFKTQPCLQIISFRPPALSTMLPF